MTVENKSFDLKNVASNFEILGNFQSGAPYGSGHIHDTFEIVYDQGGAPMRYIMQRINQTVFKQPEVVQANIEKITAHIRNKLTAAHCPDASRRTLT